MIVLIINSNCFSLDRKSDNVNNVHSSSEIDKAASPSSSLGGVNTRSLGVSAGEAGLSRRRLLSSSSFSFGSSFSLGGDVGVKNGQISTHAKNHQETFSKSNVDGKKKCHSSSSTKQYKNGKLVKNEKGADKCEEKDTKQRNKKRSLFGFIKSGLWF